MQQRTGAAIGVSMAIGMAIFVMAVASTFLLFQDALHAQTGFDRQTGAAADIALDRFQDMTDWTVYRTRIAVHSPHDVPHHPLELTTPLPPDTNPDSVLVMQDGTEIPAQHNTSANETVVVTNVSADGTRLDLVHASDPNLDARTYDTDLVQRGNSSWHPRLNVTMDEQGFDNITFRSLSLLEDAASLNVSGTPDIATDTVRTTFTYTDDDTTVRMFDRSGQIRINRAFNGEQQWQFNLTTNFTELYVGADDDTIDLNDDGVIFNGSTDFVDFSDVQGLGIAADGMYVNVSRDTASAPIEVQIDITDDNGERDVLLYAHDGNHTAAQPVAETFLAPYNVSVGVPVAVTGVSRQRAAAFEQRSYEDVRNTLGLTGSEYNITVGDVFQKGWNIPQTAVQVHAFPVTVVERYANASITDMQFRVW